MRKVLVFIMMALLLVSCGAKGAKKVEGPGELYVDGVNLMKQKKYDKAIRKFQQVRENFPFETIALVAAVKLGDAHFEKKDYVQAGSTYEEFFKAHPEDENAPYVLARLGECYEKLSPTIDRDQANTYKGIEYYTLLKNRYPNSSYAKIVNERLKKLTQKLADRELYVGEYYIKAYEYNAAVLRLEYMLKKFPDASGKDKALYYLSMAYKELASPEKSDQYYSTLKKDYPKSIFARATIRERKTLRVAKTDQTTTSAGDGQAAGQIAADFKQSTLPRREIMLTPVAATRIEETAPAQKEKETAKESKEKDFDFFDKSKPIDIVSDSMEGFDKEKYVIFKGNVIAKQDDLFIFADIIEAYLNEDTNEIDRAVAKNNVKIVKKERTATSNEAHFDNKKGEIVLKGNVVVFQAQDKLTGDVVTYYVNEDRAVVEGEKGKKARVILNPR